MEHNSCHIWGEMEVADCAAVVKFFGVRGLDRFLAASYYLMPLCFGAAGAIFWSWWLISYRLGRGIVVAFGDEDCEVAPDRENNSCKARLALETEPPGSRL